MKNHGHIPPQFRVKSNCNFLPILGMFAKLSKLDNKNAILFNDFSHVFADLSWLRACAALMCCRNFHISLG